MSSEADLKQVVQETKLLSPAKNKRRCFTIQNNEVWVDERYTVQNMIGYGAYGVVFSAFDAQTKTDVAIKKI